MPTSDGKVVIQIDENARQAAKDFAMLDKSLADTQRSALGLNSNLLKLKSAQSTLRNDLIQLAMSGKQNTTQFERLSSIYRQNELRAQRYALESTKAAAIVDAAINKNIKTQEKNAQTVESGTNRIATAFSNLKGYVVAAGVAFAGMKLAQFGQQIFKVSSQFEQLNVAFQVLAGQSAGQQLVKDLTDLANVTPMTAQGLADNARLLLSFGEASQNVISDLKLLGDISGGNQQKMDSLTLAFAQAGSAGRLMGQDLLQMVNAGFNPLQQISERTGKSMGQLKKEMEQGKISFDMIKQAMIDATSEGGRFYGMMDKQSQTLEGRLSTLADKWGLVAKNIGDFFLPAAKAAVNVFIKLGDSILYIQNQLAKLDHPLERARIGLMKFFGMLPRESGLVFTMKSNISTETAKATQSLKTLQTGFRSSVATIESVTRAHRANNAVHKQAVTEQINDYQKLQNKVSELRNNLMIMATQGKNSGDLWTKSLQNYQAAQTQLDAVNKSIETNATTQIGAYDALNNKIAELRTNLENMAVSGQAGTPAFDKMKNDYVEALNQMKDANRQVASSMGVDWDNIRQSISTDLASAFTTPLREGENAFQRFGNIATNIVQQLISKLLEMAVITPIVNSFTGGLGGGIGSFFSGLFKNAKGNAFQNGKVSAFASGGVVSSPTLFPMKNGTGLMGEAGAEAIMPLKRTSNGRLGVEATGQTSPQINIYNQSQSQIETVTRPNGETDLFIRKVNNALASERTQSGFTRASSRQNSRGITAA